MRICMVAEGCYPYTVGGVSSWIHGIIRSFPNYEFVLLTIIANREMSGKFVYELPENVTEVHELYLDDLDWSGKSEKKHNRKLSRKEIYALRNLVLDLELDWNPLFDMFAEKKFSIDRMLMGSEFYEVILDYYNIKYPQLVFSDFLWTIRSMYLPLFYTFKMKLPQADLYHCLATGYAGVLGAMAKHFYKCRLVISEHGIYTREREEELIKAKWVKDIYKGLWIDQFRKLARLGYAAADLVTSLYGYARGLQIELGCPPEKTLITPNGIDVKRFADVPQKDESDRFINVGAILRISPIKDVKTLIQAFVYAKKSEPRLKLWVMGPDDEEPEYAQECYNMAKLYELKDIEFTGRVNMLEYIGKMDFTILTSLSEGQPLTILESFAAKRPVIATNVGNCSGLIHGEEDDFGDAGIVTHLMNIEEISAAMVTLAQHPNTRREMGEAGYKRVMSRYKSEDMLETYTQIYAGFEEKIKAEAQAAEEAKNKHKIRHKTKTPPEEQAQSETPEEPKTEEQVQPDTPEETKPEEQVQPDAPEETKPEEQAQPDAPEETQPGEQSESETESAPRTETVGDIGSGIDDDDDEDWDKYIDVDFDFDIDEYLDMGPEVEFDYDPNKESESES